MTSDVSLAFLSTGTARIRKSMRSQPANRSTWYRRFVALCDREWTEPIPVGVFLIHHPEGLFLFDTGQSPCCNDSGYLPCLVSVPSQLMSQFQIERHEGVLEQLHQLGIKATDLKAVILSHLHSDHTGGLEELVAEAPDLPVYISREHWKAFGENPFLASIQGSAPNHWPKNFAPRIIDIEDTPLGPWKQSFPLTEDGRIVVVDTSGHVPGHIGLVVYAGQEAEKQLTYFLPGDATYGLDILEKEEPDGMNDDPQRALQTLKNINEFARSIDVIVLPSHDQNTPRLLAERTLYRPKK